MVSMKFTQARFHKAGRENGLSSKRLCQFDCIGRISAIYHLSGDLGSPLRVDPDRGFHPWKIIGEWRWTANILRGLIAAGGRFGRIVPRSAAPQLNSPSGELNHVREDSGTSTADGKLSSRVDRWQNWGRKGEEMAGSWSRKALWKWFN